MKSSVLVLLCSVLLAVLLQGAVSLPPDFFRTGRGGMIKLPSPHKKSVADIEVVQSACDFCAAYNPGYGDDCKTNEGGMRQICLLAFSAKVQNAVNKLTTTV